MLREYSAKGVIQWSQLSHWQVGGRRLVCRSGTDEDVLPDVPTKQGDIPFDVLRRESDPVHDHIERYSLQCSPSGLGVVNICLDELCSGRCVAGALPTVEQVQIDAFVRLPEANRLN